jgi:hypothetical protein
MLFCLCTAQERLAKNSEVQSPRKVRVTKVNSQQCSRLPTGQRDSQSVRASRSKEILWKNVLSHTWISLGKKQWGFLLLLQ